jgi:hypothetical protein
MPDSRLPTVLFRLANGIALAALAATSAPAAVLMNEFKIEDTQQFLEVRNTGPDRVPLDLLGLQTGAGSLFPLAVGDTLEPGEHRVFPLPDALPAVERIRRRGDVLELFDPALDEILDRVDFGDTGGAPADILADVASTLARVTSTPDPQGTASATAWTVDLTGTLGSANNAATPALGGNVAINEIIPAAANAVVIELYNGGPGPVDLNGWSLTSAQCHIHLAGTLPPDGFRTFLVTPLIFDFNLVVYLFAPGEMRVDQMGLSDAPGVQTTYQQALGNGLSFQRFPDGNGPHSGYDLPSIDFPISVRLGAPSPGAPNPGDGSAIADEAHAPSARLALEIAPNPLTRGGALQIAVKGADDRLGPPAPQGMVLRVYDLAGRLVDRLSGPSTTLTWTPAPGIAPGVYFLALERRSGPGHHSGLAKLTIQP